MFLEKERWGVPLKLASFAACAIGLMVGAVSGSTAVAATHFYEATTYGQGQARDMVVCDFDADGHEDVVSVADGKVSIWFGDGAGDFEIVEHPTGGGIPGDIQVGDMNGDQVLDVVTTDVQSHQILIFDGLGAGELDEPRVVAENYWGTIVLGDFGGDSALDVIASRWDHKSVVLVQGVGGEFSPTVELPISVGNASVVRDLDGDGDADLSQLSSSDEVLVFRQGPSGTFGAPTANPVDDSPTDLEVVDLDSDGHLDLVTSSTQHGGTISVVHGQADGSFEPAAIRASGPGTSALEAADLDGDGDIDLALPGYDGFARVMLQDASGNFELIDAGILHASVMGANSDLADFDEDGQDDLLLMVPSDAGIQVAFGDALYVSPTWIDFGWLSALDSATQSFTIRNTGSAPTAPGAIGVLGLSPGAFSIVGNSCTGTLGRRATCEVDVRFDAPVATDELFDLVEIQGSSASGPRYVFVEAASFLSAFLSPSPSAIDFGYVAAGRRSASREVRIVNAGDEPAEIAEVFASAGFGVGRDTCSDELLLPEDECVVSTDFRPTASSPLVGTLTVTYAGGGTGPASVGLRGTRTPPARPLRPGTKPPPVDYGPVDRELVRLTRALPKLLRGGPAGLLRLPRFATRQTGTLRVRAHAMRKGKRVALVDAKVRVEGGVPRRLSFRIASRKRKLLRASKPVRVKVNATFQPLGGGLVFRQASELLVRPPKG